MAINNQKGKLAEFLACMILRCKGFSIVAKNYVIGKGTGAGEIDIIAHDGTYYLFVEVKYRKNDVTGFPEEAVDYHKQKKICKVADYYRISHRVFASAQVRFDVIAILNQDIIWYKSAFYYIGNL